MLVNICMKFHEDILNGFQVTERKRFCDRLFFVTDSRQARSKGHNSKSVNTRVMVLKLCMSSNVG